MSQSVAGPALPALCPSLGSESFLISVDNWVTVWAIANWQMHCCIVIACRWQLGVLFGV